MRLKSSKTLHCIQSTQVIKKIFIVWVAANLTYKRIYFGLFFVTRNLSRLTIQHEGHFSHFSHFWQKAPSLYKKKRLFPIHYEGKNEFYLMSLFISLIFGKGWIFKCCELKLKSSLSLFTIFQYSIYTQPCFNLPKKQTDHSNVYSMWISCFIYCSFFFFLYSSTSIFRCTEDK